MSGGRYAGVGVGTLRSREFLSFLVPWFRSSLASWSLGFLVPEFLGFFVSKFLGFKVSKLQSSKDPMIPYYHISI